MGFLRTLGFRVLKHPFFDPFILTVIIINCVFLALYDPTKDVEDQARYIIVGDYVFLSIYVAEMLLKMGVLSAPAYFSDAWNWLDFVVVMEGVLSLIFDLAVGGQIGNVNLSALRTLRMLRPLRAATFVPQIRVLFETFVSSVYVFGTLLLCISFFLLVMGYFAYTYWSGKLHYTCMDMNGIPLESSGLLVCSTTKWGYHCPSGYSCEVTSVANIAIGYENVWLAMLQVLLAASIEGWQPVLWATADAVGYSAWVFYLICIFVGNVMLILVFPAAYSSKLQVGIERDAEKRALKVVEEQSQVGGNPVGKAPNAPSELERMLNNYSRYEEQELKDIQHLEAVRRGLVIEKAVEDPPPPRCTPFPRFRLFNAGRRMVLDDLSWFNICIYIVVALNGAFLCINHVGESQRLADFLDASSKTFTAVFVFEVLTKLIFLGPVSYFADAFNVMDFIVTLLGVVEVSVSGGTVFLAFRLIRIFRLPRLVRVSLRRSRFIPSRQMDGPRMLKLLRTALSWVIFIYAVLLLALYIFSVLGMQFFGDSSELSTTDIDNNAMAFNFRSFGQAFVTVLNLLTGSYWAETMYRTVNATESMVPVAYYISWLVLSRWVLLAAVISVLFYRVDKDGEEYLRLVAQTSMRSVYALENAFVQTCRDILYLKWRHKYKELQGISTDRGKVNVLEEEPEEQQPSLLERMKESKRSLLIFGPDNALRLGCAWITDENFIYDNQLPPADFAGFSADWWLRTLCNARLRGRVNWCYEVFMLFMVGLIFLAVAVDVEVRVGSRDSQGESFVLTCEWLVTMVFVLDFCLKTIAHGLVFLPDAYLTSPLNCMDAAVTIVSIIGLAAEVHALKDFVILRMLRIVRISRVLSKNSGLVNIFTAVVSSRRAMLISFGVTGFFWYLWSVVGLQVWMGKFNYCSDPIQAAANGANFFKVYSDEIANEQDCLSAGYDWAKPRYTFDNFGASMWSVFIIFTFDFWHPIMFDAISAPASIGDNATEWGNSVVCMYFLLAIFSFILLVYLFVGVLYGTFMYVTYTQQGTRLVSLKQAFWTAYKSKLEYVAPYTEPRRPQSNRGRIFLYNALTDKRFEHIFAAFILYNLVTRFFYAGTFPSYVEAPLWLHQQDLVCALIYVAEGVLRIYAFGGLRAVTQTAFQWMDLAITMVMFGIVVYESVYLSGGLNEGSMSAILTFFDALSVIRVVRLGTYVKTIPELAHVIIRSLSLTGPLILILFLITFAWAIIGMLAFDSEQYDGLFGMGQAYEAVNRYSRFSTVPTSMLLLIGVATSPGSNGWTPVMTAYVDATPTDLQWAVALYFITYAFMARFLIWNLFVMILIFKYKLHSKDKAGVAMEQVEEFRRAWKSFSFSETGSYMTIHSFQLPQLLWELPAPLGIGEQGCYLDAYILAKKILLSVDKDEWEEMSHIKPWNLKQYLARSLTSTGRLAGSELRSHGGMLHIPWIRMGPRAIGSSFLPPGERPLQFHDVLIALHKNVVFGEILPDERSIAQARVKANDVLTVVELGIRGFVNGGRVEPDSLQEWLQEVSFMRRGPPGAFWYRVTTALRHEFLRWREEMDACGLTPLAHEIGRLLEEATQREAEVARQQLRVLQRLIDEGSSSNSSMLNSLQAVKKHLMQLLRLGAVITVQRMDSVETVWDTASMQIVQTLEPPESKEAPKPVAKRGIWGTVLAASTLGDHESVTAMAASVDGEWIFCCTSAGRMRVHKRGKAKASRGEKRRAAQHPLYALVQVIDMRAKGEMEASVGMSVACSSDGTRIAVGCRDRVIRHFWRDSRAKGGKGKSKERMLAKLLFRPDVLSRGHKGEVTCLGWFPLNSTSSLWVSGSSDGCVRLWRPRVPHSCQNARVCGGVLGTGGVTCIKSWRVSLSNTMLAACIEAHQDMPVEAPAFLLVGDTTGALSILPVRSDAQFLTDAWKPQLKVKAFLSGELTAIETAWDMIYTAGAKSGTVKIWSPTWKNEQRRELESLNLVGQQCVHSAAITSMCFSGGILQTASEDMSIVMWHPIEKSAIFAGDSEVAKSGAAPPSVHKTDAGLIVHMGGVVCLSATTDRAISVDTFGRIVVRVPIRTVEHRLERLSPNEDAVMALVPDAKKMLKEQRERLRRQAADESICGPNAPLLRYLRRAAARRFGQPCDLNSTGLVSEGTCPTPMASSQGWSSTGKSNLNASKFMAVERRRRSTLEASGKVPFLSSRDMASPNAPVLESLLNGRGVPKWATSEMELHSLSSGEPGSFLAAVMCHYFPIKRLKGMTNERRLAEGSNSCDGVDLCGMLRPESPAIRGDEELMHMTSTAEDIVGVVEGKQEHRQGGEEDTVFFPSTLEVIASPVAEDGVEDKNAFVMRSPIVTPASDVPSPYGGIEITPVSTTGVEQASSPTNSSNFFRNLLGKLDSSTPVGTPVGTPYPGPSSPPSSFFARILGLDDSDNESSDEEDYDEDDV